MFLESHLAMVSCQKGPTRHAYAWQIGPFWLDTLDTWVPLRTRKSYISLFTGSFHSAGQIIKNWQVIRLPWGLLCYSKEHVPTTVFKSTFYTQHCFKTEWKGWRLWKEGCLIINLRDWMLIVGACRTARAYQQRKDGSHDLDNRHPI